jgi:hypothetical protein
MTHRERYGSAKWGRFLLGLDTGEESRAWTFDELEKQPLVHDRFGGRNLLVAFDRERLTTAVFDRTLDGQELTFREHDGRLVDEQTGSEWDTITGRAVRGLLEGRKLEAVAATVILERDWKVFHPATRFWHPDTTSGL